MFKIPTQMIKATALIEKTLAGVGVTINYLGTETVNVAAAKDNGYGAVLIQDYTTGQWKGLSKDEQVEILGTFNL